MYKILRFGKRFNTKSFEKYEEARGYIRRWMRKNIAVKGHATLDSFGFSIKPI